MRLTAHEEDARDVVQETYLRAWKGLKGFRGDAQFTTWLYRITANTAYTTVKRRRRHRADALDAMLEEPVETRIDAQPEESAEQSAMLARLAGALGQLPPKLRVLVVLKDVYGLVPRGDRRGARHLGGRGQGEAAPGTQAPARPALRRRPARRPRAREAVGPCSVTRSPRLLPEAVEGRAAVELSVQRHIETCLRCQVELARYRKMLRGLQLLRTRYLEPHARSAGADARGVWRRRANVTRCGRCSPDAVSPMPVRSAVRRWPPARPRPR